MKVRIDCVHCYLKQAVSAMKLGKINEEKQHEVLYQLMNEIKELDLSKSPAENSSIILLKTYELINNDDPYKKVKKESNDLALSLQNNLEKMSNEYEDKLEFALKMAVAGNVIDLGIHRSFDIDEAIHHILNIGFAVNHYEEFKKNLEKVDKVMILGDNTGEIVFDMILVNQLKNLGKEVIYVVKEGPILNDSTMEDAVYVGMDQLTKVITNGSDYLGTCLDQVSDDFKELFESSPLIISKGQANFESLESEGLAPKNTFFLLKLKCMDVAKTAGENFGDMVFMKKK